GRAGGAAASTGAEGGGTGLAAGARPSAWARWSASLFSTAEGTCCGPQSRQTCLGSARSNTLPESSPTGSRKYGSARQPPRANGAVVDVQRHQGALRGGQLRQRPLALRIPGDAHDVAALEHVPGLFGRGPATVLAQVLLGPAHGREGELDRLGLGCHELRAL